MKKIVKTKLEIKVSKLIVAYLYTINERKTNKINIRWTQKKKKERNKLKYQQQEQQHKVIIKKKAW